MEYDLFSLTRRGASRVQHNGKVRPTPDGPHARTSTWRHKNKTLYAHCIFDVASCCLNLCVRLVVGRERTLRRQNLKVVKSCYYNTVTVRLRNGKTYTPATRMFLRAFCRTQTRADTQFDHPTNKKQTEETQMQASLPQTPTRLNKRTH